ncbi:MAG: hypothetical protein A3K19_05950 [Lentisphaerae bacterium RIFOXYB12_FULL_65_16]|nr:MAG: hypothetical protein A3K18_34550 [Lentisphaerae bacterium RIFOXYA12_64_32]OGV94015.1 MAG: hypothetical protein A3K19_05950 [Lentisphaerae bacterium RIFOXYB12_FULL_65_16]
MRTNLVVGLALVVPVCAWALGARAADAPSLLKNGGFEQLEPRPGVSETGGKSGSWMLKGGPNVPADWYPSDYFGGELEVRSDGAPEGKVYVHVQAGAEREAHLHQACPGLWAAGYFKATLRYRGGPVLIESYEYRETGKNPVVVPIATGPVSTDWRLLETVYLPEAGEDFRIAVAVGKGCAADLDDVRIWPSEPEPEAERPGWLNARNYGVSGSAFETTAQTTAGSKEIVIKTPGDFRAGQEVILSKCHPTVVQATVYGPQTPYAVAKKPAAELVEFRGYDEWDKEWDPYFLDIERATPPAFRWSNDIARTWQPKMPITFDWQPLAGGLEVRFKDKDFDWAGGYTVAFSIRSQLQTVIEKIDGNRVTLRDAPKRAVADAVIRHVDSGALQALVDRALKEKRHVYLPPGRYRLTRGITVRDPEGLTIEGADGVHTVLDFQYGAGVCISLNGGTEATIRNLAMVGHSGFADRDQCGYLSMWGSGFFWGMSLKQCYATDVNGTERVLVENVHASRMSSECFAAYGPSRGTMAEPGKKPYSKAITYLRCSATDCGRNAFNDVNCGPENTSILYCRIVDVGGCAWESASRFVKFVGNYVRNAGTVAIGNLGPGNRDPSFADVGSGQHIIKDNVFESVVPYGGCAVRSCHGSTQVIIANNLFINFGSSAVEALGLADTDHFPSANTTITGNIFDMTCVTDKPVARHAIEVSTNDTIVSDNQIYVRGNCDPLVTGIRVREPALNVNIHDNLVRNCGVGLVTARASAPVVEVIDNTTFASAAYSVPFARPPTSHAYRGWNLVWLAGGQPTGVSVIDAFDTDALRFKLREPREMKKGDMFEVFPPTGANWDLHDNTVTDCQRPVVLDSYGSETSMFRRNLVTRGAAAGVKQAVEVRGWFKLGENHISGFDEPESAALWLFPDRLGRPPRNMFLNNVFDRCNTVVREAAAGLWGKSVVDGNLFIGCQTAPATGGRAPAAP